MVYFEEELDYDGNIPEAFRDVQQCLDSFVEVNYETMLGMIANTKASETNLLHYKSKVVDIIRNNPLFVSVPKYLRDGRDDYLWYSDFYDDIPKDIYHTYRTFVKPTNKITSANYTEELTKIDLPYFRELVDLVSLEKLCIKYEKLFPTPKPTPKQDIVQKEQPAKESTIVKESKNKVAKRSYIPKLTNEQYKLLADCIEAIKLFRRKVKVSELKKLLSGKLTEPLQVTNQKSLVYLFDQLMDSGYIKDTWMSVTDGNKDFISFRTEGNKERYGDNTHYINMTQLNNCRNRNKKELIHGLENIDTLIEQIQGDLAE